MAAAPRNILLIQLGDIGDVVLTAPSIRAVRETWPDSHVSVLVKKPYGELLSADPLLHEVIESGKVRGSLWQQVVRQWAFLRGLRAARYDLVVDLRTGDRGAILAWLTRAPRRAALYWPGAAWWRRHAFNELIPNDLEVAAPPVHPGADQSLRLLKRLGIATTDSVPQLHVQPQAQQRAREILAAAGLPVGSGMVTVNPYSRWKYKEWNDAKWGEVIDRIWRERQLPAVLIGAPDEAAACAAIVASRPDRIYSIAGKTTLGELAAAISLSRLHMGVDSAAPHIAAALDVPTVTVHGPTNWRGWRLTGPRHKVVTMQMPCLPCSRMGCEDSGISQCMIQLQPAVVAQAALEVLG